MSRLERNLQEKIAMRVLSGVLAGVLALAVLCGDGFAGKLGFQKIVARGRAATALVSVDGKPVVGAAFCVDESGMFLTSLGLVRSAKPGETVRLVLGAGTPKPRVFVAEIVERDEANDLALLKVRGATGLPVLPLGKAGGLRKNRPLYLFGFRSGGAVSFQNNRFPAVGIKMNTVAYIDKADGAVRGVEMGNPMNPGFAGGPVVNKAGEVVGIVRYGGRTSGVKSFSPGEKARVMLFRSMVRFTPPPLKTNTLDKPVTLTVEVGKVLREGKGELIVEIALKVKGMPRTIHRLKLVGGRFEAKVAVARRPKDDDKLNATVEFVKGEMSGLLNRTVLKLKGRRVALHEVERIFGGKKPTAVLRKNRAVLPIDPKTPLKFFAGPHTVALDLSSPCTVTVSPRATWPPRRVDYAVIVRRGGTVLIRKEGLIPVAAGKSPPQNFLLVAGDLFVYSRAGKRIWTHKEKRTRAAVPLRDGRIAIALWGKTSALALVSRNPNKVSEVGVKLKDLTAVAALDNGNLLLARRGGKALVEVTPEGRTVREHFAGKVVDPSFLRVTANGSLLICDKPNGARVGLWSLRTGKMIWSKTGIGSIASAAELGNGHIAVAGGSFNSPVRVFGRDGRERWKVTKTANLREVAAARNGNAIIIVQRTIDGKARMVILIYSPEGKKLKEFLLEGDVLSVRAIHLVDAAPAKKAPEPAKP